MIIKWFQMKLWVKTKGKRNDRVYCLNGCEYVDEIMTIGMNIEW